MPDYQSDFEVPAKAPDASTLIAKWDFRRQADLIADGIIPFPDGLNEIESRELLGMVQAVQRTKLIKFIARQIAVSIHRRREQERTAYAEKDID